MSSLKINLSDDRMEARLDLSAVAADQLARDEILQALQQAGVVFGIDEAAVDDLLRRRPAVGEFVVARGLPAQPGEDARLMWNIESQLSTRPQITERGMADFKQLSLFYPVVKDQALVCKLPATAGVAGRTVIGETISHPGADVAFPSGDNIYQSADGLTLLAEKNGHVFWEGGRLQIDTVFRIDGDVDYSTGNIKFDGSVAIAGDVRTGFEVAATGSIFIGGTVEAATIYSETGDISITAGVLGRGKARIFAGNNLTCAFLQDATVGVQQDILVERYIINSTISAGGKIALGPTVGLIRGGHVTAETMIEAREIGTEKNIPTEIILGSKHSPRDSSAEWGLREERTALENRLSVVMKRIQFLELLRSRLPKLTAERELELEQLLVETDQVRQQLQEAEDKATRLHDDWNRRNINKRIVVSGSLHRNVYIEVGGIGIHTDRKYDGVVLSRVKDDIDIGKYFPENENGEGELT
ncbi:MAG: FapA family protein [Candidatus Neomarinimicrobiota bacterium]